MSINNRYSIWNNKGGVGKSFLAFALCAEYALQHPDEDVVLVDMCPQANSSEMLLGGSDNGSKELRKLQSGDSRTTIAGYIEHRLSDSPYTRSKRGHNFITHVHPINRKISKNLFLAAGDNLLEIQAQAIYQMAQLTIPENAWASVHKWVRDLCTDYSETTKRPCSFFIDCNPSFAIYTELAMIASDDLIVPFTADDSSRRAIENMGALLYGISDASKLYRSISFSQRARHFELDLPLLHTFIANRVTKYRGAPSAAFSAMKAAIQSTAVRFMKAHKEVFDPVVNDVPSSFFDVPDYHSACIVSTTTGTPVSKIKPGLHIVHGKRVQLNESNLSGYREAIEGIVSRL